MNIAFVLLTYNLDEPAGIERSIAALRNGLDEAGHHAFVLAVGPARPDDGEHVVRLHNLRLPRPATEDDLRRALNDSVAVADEVRDQLVRRSVGLVCWVDAVWGLGYLAPAPPATPTALMVRVLRTDTPLHQALAKRPDAVLTNSPFLIDQATAAGLPTRGWQAVPNALLHRAEPAPAPERAELRSHGPVRIVARAEPEKGIAELLDAMPASFDRRVEIVLAEAAFEYWPGMQGQVVDECRTIAARRNQIDIRPALPWANVQPFLAGAAATIVSSTSPETFCNVAAEALSVGTPVIGYDLGHLPRSPARRGPWSPSTRDRERSGTPQADCSTTPRRTAKRPASRPVGWRRTRRSPQPAPSCGPPSPATEPHLSPLSHGGPSAAVRTGPRNDRARRRPSPRRRDHRRRRDDRPLGVGRRHRSRPGRRLPGDPHVALR